MADIKTLLKEARKLLDDNNYKDAQECCKNVLRKDKQNYFALILLGKSLQSSDQAPLAYQKAISSKPDHPLAWLGLAQYYELKKDELSNIKLIDIYKEILNLKIEEEKTIDTIAKLGQLGQALKSYEALVALINFINANCNEKLKHAAEEQFLALLELDIPCPKDNIPQIRNLIENIYAKQPSNSLEILHAKFLIQENDLAPAVQAIIDLEYFNKSPLLREWLCKQLCFRYIEKMSFCGLEIETYIEKITEGVTNLKYPKLLKSMIYFDKGSYLDAYKQCIPLIDYNQANITEITFIIKCTIKLKKWCVTEKLSHIFLAKVQDDSLQMELKKFLFMSQHKQQKWDKAISTAKEIPFSCLNQQEKANFAECCIEANETVDHLIETLKPSNYYVQVKALHLLKQKKYEEVIVILQNADEQALNTFYLGKAYWNLGMFEQCHMSLLKAAKLNPDCSEIFLYLGFYYQQFKNDLEKAKKCFEKAYSLNEINIEIIKNLSELYIKLGQQEADFNLLSNTIKKLVKCDLWIYFRLGLHAIHKREWEKAIIQFRNVIKNDSKNITAFECLADAYYSRGSFTSALRAYSKVIRLDPSKSSHCLTRIGYIYSLLTQYEDAINTFEKVLLIDPFLSLALKGIAETWIKVAKKKISAKVFGSARDSLQQALDYITKALVKHKQFTTFWKLIADTLILLTKLPYKYTYVIMTKKITDVDSERIRLDKVEIFRQAIACFSLIAKQKEQIASYDLASAYFHLYLETKESVNCHISFHLILCCIKENPHNWRYWNLLGKLGIFMKKFEIAQHCFIKAVTVTRKWSVAQIWCNLGVLYLKLKLYKFANYCFWRGQSTLPSYPQSWIGQGLIAENLREEESMDLFRHASRLGYHPVSALGYADWVCRTLKNDKYKQNPSLLYEIEGLYAIPYAIDLVEWYCNFEPHNAFARNILGILQERSGLIKSALKSYEIALEYAEDGKRNIVLLNIGRVLVRMERYDEAIRAYKSITEASLYSTTGLALALFKKGLYEEAYSAYDTTLHWLSNDDSEKADLLVAMAAIVYMHKGVEDAKTILFHSIQVSQKNPTPHSLFAICSLGYINTDQSLSKLALSELRKYDKNSEYGFDIGFLKSYLYVSEDNIEKAIKLMSDSLHDHPSNTLLWLFMSQYCLKGKKYRAKVASCCAQKALSSTYRNDSGYNSAKILATASIAEHIAGDHNKALKLAKEGLHLFPDQSEVWAALLLSLTNYPFSSERKNWIFIATRHMRRHLTISRPLSRWASLMEKKLSR